LDSDDPAVHWHGVVESELSVQSVDGPSKHENGDPLYLSMTIATTGTLPAITYRHVVVTRSHGLGIEYLDIEVPLCQARQRRSISRL
jgi:hypothetical protein